jgi:hypothetical protein
MSHKVGAADKDKKPEPPTGTDGAGATQPQKEQEFAQIMQKFQDQSQSIA